jgi:hypothetical protein
MPTKAKFCGWISNSTHKSIIEGRHEVPRIPQNWQRDIKPIKGIGIGVQKATNLPVNNLRLADVMYPFQDFTPEAPGAYNQ